MRAPLRIGARVLLIAGAVVVGWLAARSRSTPITPEPAREIRLPVSKASSQPLVSNLEAGRPAELRPTARQHIQVRAPEAAPAPTRSADLERAIAVVPQMHSTQPTTMDLAGAPEKMPTAREPGPGALESTSHSSAHDPYRPTFLPSTETTILIRGGMGGVDDKCDLHRRRGVGSAINRLAPPLRTIR